MDTAVNSWVYGEWWVRKASMRSLTGLLGAAYCESATFVGLGRGGEFLKLCLSIVFFYSFWVDGWEGAGMSLHLCDAAALR